MRIVANVLVGLGLLVLANGVVAYFLRWNFITQEKYGPSLVPLYIVGAGIGTLVIGAVFKTMADAQQAKKNNAA